MADAQLAGTIPRMVVTWNERTFECGECSREGITSAMLLVFNSSGSAFRRSNIEIVVVGNRKNRRDNYYIISDRGIDSQGPAEISRSRVDLSAGVNVDDADFPLEMVCHRCGHQPTRGLGRRRFERLLAQDGSLVL